MILNKSNFFLSIAIHHVDTEGMLMKRMIN